MSAPSTAGFALEHGTLRFRATGVRVKIDRHLVAEVAQWVVYLAVLAVLIAPALFRSRRAARIWFTPQRPGPWYLARGAALVAGIRAAPREAEAEVAFYFDDVTTGRPPASRLPGLNFGCVDTSKSRVAAAFEAVFGYPLAVDPAVDGGLIVEKSQKNGVHDGRLVRSPTPARPGRAYQRFVDTADDAGVARDLRTVCVGRRPVLVWVKEKPAGARFSINNRRAVLREPDEVFSPAELADIGRLCEAMRLDWGGLDILRERADGRLYVVDVNKTDLGPVIALSWPDKIRSMRRLGAALESLVARMGPQARLARLPQGPGPRSAHEPIPSLRARHPAGAPAGPGRAGAGQ